jgi:heavy metal sensor kinase
MFTKSIRGRMLLWLAFLLACILSGFGVTAFQLYRINQFVELDEQLKQRVAALSADVRGRMPGVPRSFGDHGPRRPPPERKDNGYDRDGPPPRPFEDRSNAEPRGFRGPPDRGPGPGPGEMRPGPRRITLSEQTLALFEQADTNSFYFSVWSRGGTPMKNSANAPADVPRPDGGEADTRPHARTRGAFREVFHFTEIGECVLAGRSISGSVKAQRQFSWWLGAAGCGVLLLGLGGGWWLISSGLRPVHAITAAASRISEGNLAERINATDTDNELGRLAGVLNSTFARLDAAFAQQKQFTADASHELRTPLAVLISEAQATLSRERNAAEYRETIEACLATAQQMRRLTESLLQLARFDAAQQPVERERIDVAARAASCIERIAPLAAARGIQIHSDLSPASTMGGGESIDQVVTNLLTNAIHYNRDGGEVRVHTRADGGDAVITVADTGLGIAEPDLPHIFKRFYRADKSRARADGRNGLGLAICKAIVEAHAGQITVSTGAGQGTVFTVRLPLSSAASDASTES